MAQQAGDEHRTVLQTGGGPGAAPHPGPAGSQGEHQQEIGEMSRIHSNFDCDRVSSWLQCEVRARVSLAWAARLTGWTTCLC